MYLLVTQQGLIRDFALAPANVTDLEAGVELLEQHRNLHVLGDKGSISRPVAEHLRVVRGVDLVTVPRRNQRVQPSDAFRHLHAHLRQLIETVNSQLARQFHVEINHAHTCWGLCARLLTKLTAHTLCVWLNHLLGTPDLLQIKGLAFPTN